MKHQRWILWAAALLGAAMAGCAAAEPLSSGASAPSEVACAVEDAQTPDAVGYGTLDYGEDAGQALSDAQEQLLLDYMGRYYDSLADFTVRDADDLFTADAAVQAAGNEAVWSYLIGLRGMQQTDLRLVSYRYALTILDVEAEDDGEVRVTAMEDGTENFAAHPEVDSKSYGAYHLFAMEQTAGGWKLTSHAQWNTLYLMMMGSSAEDWQERPGLFPDIDYDARVSALLAEAGTAVASRSTQGESEEISAAHAYDRDAAVAYAHRWADDRSDDWPDYTMSGGNCQNYVSQCLLAGGIPMDPYGDAVWKWYGSDPNSNAGTYGRSSSWSAVKAFIAYADANSGYGLVSQTDAPYYSGEAGDVLEMGFEEDDWRHTVIIVDTVKDEDGNTVDYLVDSNTAGLRNYPVSAHPYFRQMLVKVYGWNG